MNRQPANCRSCRLTSLFVFVLSAVIVLPGCPARTGPGPDGTEFIDTVPLPEDVFTLYDEAMAIRVHPRAGDVLKNAQIDIAAIKGKHAELNEVALFEYSKRKIQRKVEFRREGDTLFADLRGGRTYLITRTQRTGPIAAGYELLCILNSLKGRVEPNEVEPICAEILCAPDVFRADELFTKFPVLAEHSEFIRNQVTGEQVFDDLPIGGLFPLGPGNVCVPCTRVQRHDGLPKLPIQECAMGPPCGRRGETALAEFDFENDAVGSPPSGLNVGAASGSAIVVDSSVLGSKALQLSRATMIATEVAASVARADGTPLTSGKVYIEFRAHGEIITSDTEGAQRIAAVASDGSEIFHLMLFAGKYHLWDGNVPVPIAGSYDPGTAHTVHITVNLNLKLFSICIDGISVASGKSFLSTTANDLQSFEFVVPAAIFEPAESVYLVDDIHLSR